MRFSILAICFLLLQTCSLQASVEDTSGIEAIDRTSWFGGESYLQVAQDLLWKGDVGKTLKVLRTASRLAREDGRYHDLYNALVAEGQVLVAHELPQALTPTLSASHVALTHHLPLPPNLVPVACSTSYKLRDSGNPTQALSILNVTLTVCLASPHTSQYASAIAHVDNDMCNLMRGLGDLSGALMHCEDALRRGDGHVDDGSMALFSFNYAKVLSDLGRHEEAAEQFMRADHQVDADALVSRALALLAANRINDALSASLLAWSKHPNALFPYVATATILCRLGGVDAALPVLRLFKQIDHSGHYHDNIVIAQSANSTMQQITADHAKGTPHSNNNASFERQYTTHAMRLEQSDVCSGSRACEKKRVGHSDVHGEGGRLKAAILYLTSTSTADIADLKESLHTVDIYLQVPYGPYPIIIFHDGLSAYTISSILDSASHHRVKPVFELVDLSVPNTTRARLGESLLSRYLGYGLGYRGMCRFFSQPMYELASVKHLDYYMRLDVDSFFLKTLPYDPFRYLHDRQLVYGYLSTGKEDSTFSINLWKTVIKHFQGTKNKRPTLQVFANSSGDWDGSFYYTNFEVSRVDFWRSDAYLELFRALDESGGFYRYRWGDGPVHLIAVALLLEGQQSVMLPRISYWHQNFVRLHE